MIWVLHFAGKSLAPDLIPLIKKMLSKGLMINSHQNIQLKKLLHENVLPR